MKKTKNKKHKIIIFKLRLLFLTLLILFIPSIYSADPNEIKNTYKEYLSAIKDYTQINFKDNPVKIDSNWIFYAHHLLTGEEFQNNEINLIQEGILVSKGIWSQYLKPDVVSKESDPSFAIGTYIMLIKLDSNKIEDELAIKLKNVGGSYRAYWNGKFLGSEGNFQLNHSDKKIEPSRFEKIFAINNLADTNVLAIQISNFNHPRGGLWTNPTIGIKKELEEEYHKNIANTSFIAGGLILLGLYQLVQFFGKKSNYRSLLFAIFCILTSLRILSMAEVALHSMIPQLPRNLFLRFEYLGFYGGVLVAVYYCYSLIPKEKAINILWLKILSIFFIIPILFCLFGSLYLLVNTLFYMQIISIITSFLIIFFLVQIFRYAKFGKIWLMSSFLILIFASLYDIYISLSNTREGFLMGFALLAFSLLQAVYLSSLSSEEQREAEQGLKAAQYQLIQSEKLSTLGIMVAGVAHEINSPLGAIKSSSSSLEESLNSFWNRISDLNKIINDGGLPKIQNWLELSNYDKKTLSSKEEREIKRKLLSRLEEHGLEDADEIVDKASDLGLHEIPETSFQELKDSNHFYLDWALRWKELLHLVSNIHKASLRAGKIVLSLKTFTHFDPNAQNTEHNIIESIENVIEVFHNSIKKGIDLHTDFDEIPSIQCYPDELIQVWTNMIHNAIQAMDGKGKLIIEVKRELLENKEYISTSFQDNGKGVPEELKQKIFDPFFTTKPIGEGTGLGLHITKQIIEKHNGIIQLDSNPGKTIFRILIPIKNN
ncbi:MAG: ATP-binding protein [Leptospiraceae bacterium]|nr:ATP-binding protein [Leptospiraceae bacterium]